MIDDLHAALTSAGATKREVFILAGISFIFTGGNPDWAKGDGRGAWGVSQQWYPDTPSDLAGQARQALRVFRQRGLSAVSDSLALAALTWWYPSGVAPMRVKRDIEAKAQEYARRVKSGFTRAGVGWAWVLVAAVVIGLLWRS